MAETEPDTYTLGQAAGSLGVSTGDVRAYIEEGLVTPQEGAAGEAALSRADMRRLWSVVTLHRDLGINLAGVSAVLRLREQYEQVRRDLATLVEIVERELGPDVWDRLWPDDRPPPHANVSVEGMADAPGPGGGEAGRAGDSSGDGPDAPPPAEEAGGGEHPPDEESLT